MGIRFACHSCQHALHVKDFQAGRRGKCPECKTVFQIPAADAPESIPVEVTPAVASSDQQISGVIPNQTRANQSTVSDASAEPTQSQPVNPPQPPEPSVCAWYLRLPDGQQFGPVDEPTFMQWLAEGRVVTDSHVWRDGWPDWQAATSVFPAHFAAVPPRVPCPPQPNVPESTAVHAASSIPTAAPSGVATVAPATQASPALPSDSTTIAAAKDSVGGLSPAQRARLDKRLKKKRNYQIMLVGLCVAAVVLICALIVVVMSQNAS